MNYAENKYHFTEQAIRILRDAGWKEDRHVDIRDYVTALQKRGCTVFPIVRNFLTCFGGLVINYPIIIKGETLIDQFDFDVVDAVSALWPDSVEYYMGILGGVPLCPIGAYSYKHAWLFMDEQGSVYGGSEDDLYFLGETPEQAIEHLIANRFVPIHIEPEDT